MSWRATQELLLVVSGVPSATQYLYFDCEDGRPSAVADVQVWMAGADDTSAEEACTTGSAAAETNPNTTIATAAVGPAQSDPTAMVVASGTGFTIGRRYLITEDGTGVSEFFECASVSGTSIKAKHPLVNDYSVGSTVQSTRWSIAVDSTWIADLSNLSPTFSPNPTYRVRWIATVNGNQTVYTTAFDVVRYPVNHGVTPLDVDSDDPGWIDRLPPDYRVDQGRGLIEAAYQVVKHELYGDGRADQAVRNPELIARLVIKAAQRAAIETSILRGAQGMEQALELAEKKFRQTYDQAFRSPMAPVDATGGGGATTVEPLPLWVRL
jgi:hypothetical protein